MKKQDKVTLKNTVAVTSYCVFLFVLNQRIKTAISFVIILSLHTAPTFPQCDCPKDFTGELQDSYAIFMNASNYKDAGPHKFDKAHIVLWTTTRAKISEKDPSVSLDT